MVIQEMFKQFTNANFFSRVDSTHILNLFIGLDDKKRKCIELREFFVPKKLLGTTLIEVSQYTKPNYNTIRFSLIDDDVSGLFYKFCEDLIEQTRVCDDKSKGYKLIINRFLLWKKMFHATKSTLLKETEIMGLIGEILCLRGFLAEKYGYSLALKGWSGQELTHKDFSYDNYWYESKAISSASKFVKISSLNQLESDKDGELVVHRLEKMSPAYKGINLNRLVLETKRLFQHTEDKDKFMTCIALQGYMYHDYYDDFVYEISGLHRYLVTRNFPKLTSNDLPKAISKAVYEIALTEIAEYELK